MTQRDGVPFVPTAMTKDLAFSGAVLLAIAACAMLFGPFGPGGQPDPTIIQTAPRPDYFFLWLYAVLSLLPPSLETPVLLAGPAIALAVFLGLPFFSGEGEKSWKRRPVAVLTILLVAVSLGTFTHLAIHAPWSPVMDAWSSDPIPVNYLRNRTALQPRWTSENRPMVDTSKPANGVEPEQEYLYTVRGAASKHFLAKWP